MSNSAHTPHIDDEQLLQLLDGELPGEEAAFMRSHVEQCGSCRARLAEIESVSSGYQRYHDLMARQLPPPPAPWTSLEPRFAELEASVGTARIRRSSWHPVRWIAAAAAAACAIFAIRSFTSTPTVSAAELLRKASSVQSASRDARRIQIKVRGRTLTRAASLTSVENAQERELRALFERAHFSWEEPLSAPSFASWRNQLDQKRDEVRIQNDYYVIETSAPSSELHRATLTLRKPDLQPTREMLEFINETVEITAAPEDNAVSQTGHPSARVPLQAPPAPQAFSASHRDVQVFAALHKIGADLGEPVEMREDGSRLLITGAGLSALQKQELRTSLSGISGVELRFEDANAKAAVAPSKSHGTEPTTAPPQLRLQALLGSGSSVEDFVNRVLDASDGMMARAHALRALAKAFPANTEAGMTPDDRSIVGNLRGEHASALKSRVDELGSILAPVIKTEAAGEGAASQPGSWQSAALGVFSAAEGLDELLTRTLAGADRAADDEDFRRIAAALARLRTQLRAL